jgi:Domain of unknown function (DUF4386)
MLTVASVIVDRKDKRHMASLVKPAGSSSDARQRPDPIPDAERNWRPIYRIGGWAAAAVVALVVVQAPLLILYPIPATVLGHFQQIQDNKLIGLINLDLVMLVSELLIAAVFVALYAALRKASPLAVTAATGIGLSGILLYVAVNPTFSFLYLSDQYAAASTEAQRAAFLAAGEAIWANYQGTAFGVAYVLGGIATLILASVMLRSSAFSKWTAYAGLVLGATMLIPPLPALGTVGLLAAFLSLVPLVAWESLLAWRLLHLARGSAGAPVRGSRSTAQMSIGV